MSDRNKTLAPAASKTAKPKRPSTVNVVSTSSRTKLAANVKEKTTQKVKPSKIDKNATVMGENDANITRLEPTMPDYDAEYYQIAYGKFLRTMLEECLGDEKIEREETPMDIQMGHLAERFQKTIEQLDKTNRRMKEISFVVEQKRLLDLKNNDCSQFYSATANSNAEQLVEDVSANAAASLDKLETKNVDFGYDKDTGHKQLLDAINDAIDGLEQIKKNSKLDMSKFKEYADTQRKMDELEKDRFDLESLKSDFDVKFPNLSEKLLKEVSEKIAKVMDDDDD